MLNAWRRRWQYNDRQRPIPHTQGSEVAAILRYQNAADSSRKLIDHQIIGPSTEALHG